MSDILCLYLDDSGTRNPDKNPPQDQFRNWFALGGVIIREEDEPIARQLHKDFCDNWNITYPLHSVDIRARSKAFSWLRPLPEKEYKRFMRELTTMLVQAPVIGHACVIDRPGYDARYREIYGDDQWLLCKTTFSILVERVAKYALRQERRLRVQPEHADPTAEHHIDNYYKEMRQKGMPFNKETSGKYKPLSQGELEHTLYDLKYKFKSSPMAQFADLYLYPIARGRYQNEYRPYQILITERKLIDAHVPEEHVDALGVKYSCFELVNGEN